MQLQIRKVRQGINKAYLKVKPNRSDIDRFKTNLIQLLDHSNDVESEEFHKNLVADFLKKTYYDPNHFINTKERNDLVIHNGKAPESTVGVIIEAKKPTNKAEMLNQDNINYKAFHELILYYLRERIAKKNLEIKYLVVTNIYEWFVFDASVFEKLFAQNKGLIKQFEDFEADRLAGTNTDFFYNEIAKPFVAALKEPIECTYFDLQAYEKPLRNNDKKDDAKLIALFKLFSPEHLLKLPFANDSNSLDKKFYTELLHLIGLEETKDKGKKVIGRSSKENRNSGSLLENTIDHLESRDKLSRLPNIVQYGATKEERLFNVGLELCITWVNRILFLKLLEAQLISFHKGNSDYTFLNRKYLKDYDELDSLFFEVLALKPEDRNSEKAAKFFNVPYLNSSLFEPTDLEHDTLFISNLADNRTLPIHSNTVLKSDTGKKRTGELDSIEYLFSFLDAYDFSSEGSEDIQEDNKTLINASVLGLIFEKINGYKDGSFFTPGFITMYMCKETIRRAVVQKFNDAKEWTCETIDDLYDKIEDRDDANQLINSLKICDPAVGSGHFLVSALNEIIAIKNDLRILQDREGKRLKEYVFEVVNDELIVTDDDGELFEYHFASPESQRVQEALFHEKQTIIENCLFGVDINPNSVKICRLRLWIELLKSAYYKTSDHPDKNTPRHPELDSASVPTNKKSPLERGFRGVSNELETLPNIDINIKCGNSLISRFALDADLKDALKKSKWSIDSYRIAVDTYRNAQNKEQKREMEHLIEDIKSDFRSEINKNDPKILRLKKLSDELVVLTTQTSMFEQTAKEKKEWKKTTEKLTTQIKKLETEIEEIKSNKIYENAFEWRFEFPEVLNDQGDFVGFDVVIGNPPYVFARDNFDENLKSYYYQNYQGIDYQINLYVLFIERTLQILNTVGGYGLIIPDAFLMVSSTEKIREVVLKSSRITEIVSFLGETFEGVNVETIIVRGQKKSKDEYISISKGSKESINFSHKKSIELIMNSDGFELNIHSNEETDRLIKKLETNSEILDNLVEIKSGLKAYEKGKGNPKQSSKDVENRIYDFDYKFDEVTYPYLEGKDVNRYWIGKHSSYLKYGNHLAAPRTFDIFESPKIIVREITSNHPYSLIGSYTEDVVLFNMSNIAINEKETKGVSLKYILAVLNSVLISYYFQINTAKAVRKLFPKIILRDLRKFPFKELSKTEQLPFIKKVDQILALKKADPEADTSALEAEIDQMVYKLYGLTEEEIKIVEESVG